MTYNDEFTTVSTGANTLAHYYGVDYRTDDGRTKGPLTFSGKSATMLTLVT